MLWGIVSRANVDHAELLWEEFVQAIRTFSAHKGNCNNPTKKTTPHVILYCRFTKLITYYLGREHNLYRRPESAIYVTGYDFPLGNLKFVPKAKEGRKKKTAPKADKPVKPAPAKQPKHVKEKSTKPTHSKIANKGKVRKVRKGKSPLQLVDKEEPTHPKPEPEPQGEDVDYDLQRGIQMSLESFLAPVGKVAFRKPAALGITQKLPVVEGKGKGIDTDEQVAQSLLELQTPKKKSTTNQYIFQRQIPVTQVVTTRPSTQPENDTSANMVRVSPSPTDAETAEEVSKTVTLKERTIDLYEGQAGSDPDADLAARISALKKKYAEFEQKNKTLENTTKNLESRIFNLELRDLPHKINQTVNEVVKEAIQTTLQAPL
ncbi:hypothetical protein Tco_1276152 [Tanacetum coccineum]